jgi:alkylhydroperoxidase/carboxymuconolactone decarboxylase family protein YurZ
MNKNWLGIITEMSAAVKELRSGSPNVMKEFSALARAALEPKALDIKTKELIALAISVATRCDPCIGIVKLFDVSIAGSRIGVETA